MHWPIRLQIFVPFAALLAIAVVTSAVTSAILSARRTGAAEVQQLARVVDSLDAASFPLTYSVLERMRGLSGAEFVVLENGGRVVAATLGDAVVPHLGEAPALLGSTTSLSAFPAVEISEQSYFVASIKYPDSGGRRQLYVLYPRARWEQLRWDAAWPPLAVGGMTLLLMLVVSGWLADRFGRRIENVRTLFVELEAGRHPQLETPVIRDELSGLIESANELSARLEVLQREIARTERLRIVAQLAGGFAHQLRNAVTGARMAVQLHQRHCSSEADDDSLSVAIAQLKLTEQQVQGLLSLSRAQPRAARAGDLSAVLQEVVQLVRPNLEHWRIDFASSTALQKEYPLRNVDAIRGALLNLLLNAIDAAGVRGRIRLSAGESEGGVIIAVDDSGSGPSESIRDRLFEPFVTNKPEGVGLGLALAHEAAREQGGVLTWRRIDAMTRFHLQLPREGSPAEAESRPAASLPEERSSAAPPVQKEVPVPLSGSR